MRRILSYLTLILALLLAATSCVVDLTPQTEPLTPLARELGLDEPEIPVCIGFQLPFEEPALPATKGSIVSGEEDPEDYVKNLYMLCFTKEGIYIGYREAELIGEKETVFAPHDGIQCQGRELFMGSVPGRTAHIHFVGNVTESNIPGNAQIGSNENTIMHSAKTSVNATDNKRVTYWGYHCEESSEKMREWLAVLNTETQEYEKIPGHNVHLVRDRARVQFRYMFDFTHANSQTVVLDGETYNLEKNPTDYTIESIDWILSNGLNQGYIAPYCLSSEDHFDAYIDFSQNPARLKKDRLTAYDRADASRYTAAESDLVRIYTRPTESGKQPYEGTVDNPLFLFEDINNASNPPRIILKVVYTATVNGSSVSKTKYHVLMLLNEEKQPRTVYRNHNYILDIYGLPWEGIGYSSFEDALTGTNYSNNLTVSISDAVHEINNGRFSMELEDTYLIYQDTADHDQYKTVNFTYKAVGNGETTAGITADNFKVGWQLAEGEQVAESFAHPEVTVIDFVNNTSTNTITGKIRFQLGSTISATELQSGIIRINDTNSGFTRYVHVYTLQKFDFKPSGVSEIKLEEVTGVSRQVNGVSCQTYKMTLRIPGNYPVGLYPIRIRMATTTLNPYQVDWTDAGGTVHHETDVTVLMEGTENGDMLEGEQLAGMNFTTDANKWNSRAAGSPWNYWYTYRILSKPEKTTNGVTEEDNTDKTYTIYFDDVRQLRAEANRSTDIGLFLKIKYFGDAVTVVP